MKHVKLLFYTSALSLAIVIFGYKYVTKNYELVRHIMRSSEEKNIEMKYILQWTSPFNTPFVYMGKGRHGFIDRNCTYNNCIVTSNKSYFDDHTKFDVIAFAGPEVLKMVELELPISRSSLQKYVFASVESAENYPVCSRFFNDFFNWTWTYRLDSDVRWGYITIKDSLNRIIGPRKEMHWLKLEDMDPVAEDFKQKLKTKRKAAAWFVSNCISISQRERFVRELQMELNRYKQHVDVYGDCGLLSCSRDNEDKCNKLIEDTYYFYLSFENSFDEDYVTEKLLRPLRHNAVPIVYGGANYTRFMPDGVYLNARELGIEKLAKKMNELIHNPDKYAEYFRWKKHYTYHKTSEIKDTNEYCNFCAILNDKDKVTQNSIYHNFYEWWGNHNQC